MQKVLSDFASSVVRKDKEQELNGQYLLARGLRISGDLKTKFVNGKDVEDFLSGLARPGGGDVVIRGEGGGPAFKMTEKIDV